MSSIRPLFTIAVLVVVGAYLYWKINEGPTRPRADTQAASNQIGDGVPPLAVAPSGATLSQDSAAPAWPPASSTAPPAAPAESTKSPAPPANVATDIATSSSAPADAMTKSGLPDVPPIPELPELPSTAGLTTAPTQPAAQPTARPTNTSAPELPINNADPRYGNAAGPNLGASTASALTLPTGPAASVASTPPTTTDTLPIGSTDTAPSGPGSQPLDPLGPVTTPPASPQSSLPSPAPGAPVGMQPPDRYAPSDNSTNPSAISPLGAVPASPPSAPAAATFAASWPAIQAALDGGDLKQAHQLLSKWHANDSLTAAESEKVETLLAQLAGTVIYSTEHQLEPARVVNAGETLDTIAKEYNVPSQLLAKINNITAPDQLRPGQQLKVVRGSFAATVDLRRNELMLEVDGRYAGTFPITLPPGANITEGQWLVDQKLGGSQAAVATASYSTPPAPADRTIVLRNESSAGAALGGPTLTIASSASAIVQPAGTAIRVAPQDAEDLSDILSIGSRVIIRR
jgi:LysM repeat protein